MYHTPIESIAEVERIAYETDNQLALQLVAKIDQIIESLEILKADNVSVRELEYIRLLCGLENNW